MNYFKDVCSGFIVQFMQSGSMCRRIIFFVLNRNVAKIAQEDGILTGKMILKMTIQTKLPNLQ